MNMTSRIVAIGLSFCFILLILSLIKRQKLKEKYAMLWLLSGSVIFLLAVFERALDAISAFLGIILPINTVFFFGIFFVILINLHFSLVISNLSEQNKKIAQKLAFLEREVEEKK